MLSNVTIYLAMLISCRQKIKINIFSQTCIVNSVKSLSHTGAFQG